MKRVILVSFALILLLFPALTGAWNKTGHFVVASIAYELLLPNTKMQVDAILARHPDFSKWVQGVPAAKRGKAAFINAAGWPDDIKSDPRFFDPGDPKTPEIPGLPTGSNKRNRDWHYTNIPFTMDDTPLKPPAATNVVTKLQEFQSIATFPKEMQTYVVPWLIHLAGDIHQPLHTVALFRQDLLNGDSGGNGIDMKGGGNLHTYWDGRVGGSLSDTFIEQTAATAAKRTLKPAQISIDPAIWVLDSVRQRFFVYSFIGEGTHQDQAAVSVNYATNAKLLAFEQAAMAGYRLAEFLNQKLP